MPKTITMLRDFPVARDGIKVEKWLNGETYPDVADDLADDLIAAHHAIEVTGDKIADEDAADAARLAIEAEAAEEPKSTTSRKK
jgi:hypothetical protein